MKAALDEVGLWLEPAPSSAPNGPGLILFDRTTEGLRESVRRYGDCGCERILAVHVGPTPVKVVENWQLLGAGASDVLEWSDGTETAEVIRARVEQWREIDAIVETPLVRDHLVGRSRAWMSVLRQVVELACFSQTSVLITGATGTGKELVARLIHTIDRRPDKTGLIVLDCSTISPELSGSEFFGHERGAFTSAVSAREGAFALADRGTLFLDEVGELPLRLQAELLRVVQEGTYKKLGGSTWQKTDFRLVCATNRDLQGQLDSGALRRDFYYRIASARIHLPELDKRREDILPLARHFLLEGRPDRKTSALDPALRDYLLTREYPGNVRDLRQLVLQIGLRHVGPGPCTMGSVPEDQRPDPGKLPTLGRDGRFETSIRAALAQGAGLKQIKETAADAAVRIALADEKGDVRRVARRLGVTDRAIQLRRRGWEERAKSSH